MALLLSSSGSIAALILFIIFGLITTAAVLSQAEQRVFAQKQQQQQPNSQEANKLLIQSFVQEVFNKHNLTALDKYYAPNATQHNPSAGQGRQGFKDFFMPFFLAFPDMHVTIEHIIAENSVVCVS